MSLINVTIDDFDPPIAYSNYADWRTQNPQDHPTWWNATPEVTGSIWHEATYHWTDIIGAQASLNFTGSAIYIYGATGASPNYTVTLDSSTSTSFTTPNATQGRTLLFSTDELTYSPHSISLTNNGGGVLLDLIVLSAELGAEGATLMNTTVDETSSEFQYQGNWMEENGSFYNGSSIYTQGPNNAFTLNFTGSAIYLFGDQVNDHGLYSIYFNQTIHATYNGRSGCGGGYAKYCEKLGGLRLFAGNLPAGEHSLKVVNESPVEGNVTFFDFDYAVYTTPSMYSTQSLTGASCPFMNCTTSTGSSTSASMSSGTTSPSGTTASSMPSKASGAEMGIGVQMQGLMFGILLSVWALKLCI